MGRRERAAALESGEDGKRKKKRRKASSKGGFEVVGADYKAAAARPAAKEGKKATNTLREAHRRAGEATTPSARRAEELWFRKCGHGETLFKAYYKAQPLVLGAGEFDGPFLTTLGTRLPVTFRLHRTTARARTERTLAALTDVARPVAWAQGEGIYEVLRDKAPVLSAARAAEAAGPAGVLARLLRDGVAEGALNRQEVVSMLPVMALGVEAGHACLDTCASPGSKTMQLLEALTPQQGEHGHPHPPGEGGVVVANDAHPKRVATLLETIRRHGRDCARLIVTCHRGEAFPRPCKPFRTEGTEEATRRIGFDRVLCDVPCSGDGTIRKDSSVLARWTPAVANQLHANQVEIAWRGLELLKPGGRLCYSTCSLNPCEDEAVVAALLARANANEGSLVVEAWPADLLPHLKRREGLTHWRVADHVESYDADDDEVVNLRWHVSYEDALAARMPHATPTLWPPPEKGNAHSSDVTRSLKRCSRILPHDQDTGGFFVALLRKLAPFAGDTTTTTTTEAADDKKRPPTTTTTEAPTTDLPPLDDPLDPLSRDETARAAQVLHLDPKQAKRRLLRRRRRQDADATAAAAADDIHIAPPAIRCFHAADLNVASAGILAKEHIRLQKNATNSQGRTRAPRDDSLAL